MFELKTKDPSKEEQALIAHRRRFAWNANPWMASDGTLIRKVRLAFSIQMPGFKSELSYSILIIVTSRKHARVLHVASPML